MRGLCALFLLLLWPLAAAAEDIVAGLSQSRVSITADFDGSEILVYGAVRREAPPPEGPPLGVIVTVEGPATPVTIRRKDRVAGIWINNAAVRVDAAPAFYALASSGPLDRLLSGTEDLRHAITLPKVIRAVGITEEADDAASFVEALMRVRLAEGTYRLLEGRVQLAEETLFRADIELPANLIEGEYRVRLFLTRGGEVIAAQERTIFVRKVGLERLITTTAHEQPLLYGLISLVLAALAGWAASEAFRLLRL